MDAPARRAPDLFKPTLVAGIAFGTAAGLPGTSLLNLCLCAPAWGAGIGAAFLFGRACREAAIPFPPGEGAKVGFLAGVIYALAATTVFLVLLAVMGGSEGLLREVEQTSDQIPWFSEELLNWMRGLARSGWLPAVMGGSLFVMHLVAGTIFSTLGGLIAAAMLRPAPR